MKPFEMNQSFEVPDTPLLIAIEIQREYTTKGRPYFMEGIDESLENCRKVLTHAREKNWTVAHVRHEQPGTVFGQSHAATQFVKGFEPLPREYLFTKSNFSCYSNPGFEKFMETSRPEQVYLIGYSSPMCCLSTIVEGYHRGHELTFVTDASLARATPNAEEKTAHMHATHIISFYANLVETAQVLGDASRGFTPYQNVAATEARHAI
jgi:ureidoacrylate peracid hydrolase